MKNERPTRTMPRQEAVALFGDPLPRQVTSLHPGGDGRYQLADLVVTDDPA